MQDPYGESEEPSEELSEKIPRGKNIYRSEDEEAATTNAAKKEWQEVQPESSDETGPIPWWAGAFGACPDMKDGAEARGFYVRRFCELFFPDDTAGAMEVSKSGLTRVTEKAFLGRLRQKNKTIIRFCRRACTSARILRNSERLQHKPKGE